MKIGFVNLKKVLLGKLYNNIGNNNITVKGVRRIFSIFRGIKRLIFYGENANWLESIE